MPSVVAGLSLVVVVSERQYFKATKTIWITKFAADSVVKYCLISVIIEDILFKH